MRELMTNGWLLSLAIILSAASSTSAQDNQHEKQVDSIFGSTDPLIVEPLMDQPLYQEVGGPPCEVVCETKCNSDCREACDSTGSGHGYLFGPDEAYDLSDFLLPEDAEWDIGGWMEFGYQNANDGAFNTYPNHFQAQQLYVYAEKVADGTQGIDFGGRADLIYGTDASNTQAFGNHPGRFDYKNNWDHGVYGWAIPQLYAEVAYKKLSVKIGHFYTLLGYQVIPAPGNFFYSMPYAFNFAEAFTHTGALATYTASENITFYGGYTFGWDTGFDQFRNGSNFLGGARIAVTDDLNLTYIVTAGNLGWVGQGYSHSIIADYIINDKWEYVFLSDLISVSNSPSATGATNGYYNAVGVENYLYYQLTDNLRAGARVEWFKPNGTSIYEMAYGLNYRPMANLVLRPEVHYNWTPGYNGVPAGGLGPLPVSSPNATTPGDYNNQFVFAVDVVITF